MKTVKEVASELGVPKISVYKWLERQEDVPKFGVQYILSDELVKRFKEERCGTV